MTTTGKKNQIEWAQKHDICNRLDEFVKHKGSQKKASVQLGVSNAMISLILAHKWDKIADEMWHKISANVGRNANDWNVVEDITTTQRLSHLLTESQQLSLVFGIISPEGSGKTKGVEIFSRQAENVLVVSCKEYMERKDFILELFKSIGKEPNSSRVSPMMAELLEELKKMYKPCIILDEADKLHNNVLNFFITFYNELEDICSINLLATSYLEKRIRAGAMSNKKGFREIYSRLGKKFIGLGEINYTDVYKICHANGVAADKEIQQIYNDCHGDLRRVKRLIRANQRKKEASHA